MELMGSGEEGEEEEEAGHGGHGSSRPEPRVVGPFAPELGRPGLAMPRPGSSQHRFASLLFSSRIVSNEDWFHGAQHLPAPVSPGRQMDKREISPNIPSHCQQQLSRSMAFYSMRMSLSKMSFL
ncbi:hypothetical protein AXG93_1154s2040 [Marchantia polymorpha subsp. ruderalis]|uniref:Uncharacterized protein n=1 Tax=Marchantia polymorpha subsp. ruderalis TaxID=1480154 RepID=A0A176WRJ3_MARPO|nr:hypothetical protein AXG93_1154s2040 [Marchantia polymorpha subsp. ruderalis]